MGREKYVEFARTETRTAEGVASQGFIAGFRVRVGCLEFTEGLLSLLLAGLEI